MKKKTTTILALTLSMTLGLSACSSGQPSEPEQTPIASEEATDPPSVSDEPTQEETPTNVSYRITEEANEEINMMNKPESPYWFPAELLSWNPEEDADINLYKAAVPLAERVSSDKLNPVNSTQNKDFKVANLSIMNSSTSGNSPRGLNKFSANTFSYWQYVDKLVYWAGSSGEGLIVAPSADVIDAAHKNGVPVLGTIFFPMAAHGGKIEWLDDFLVKDDNGKFPIVDKLIETASVLGFDGWFLNQETEGTEEAPLTKEHASQLLEFVQQFNEASGDDISLIWYDSMTEEGKMDWQNALTDKNDAFLMEDGTKGADEMFLNFWWTSDSLAKQKLLKASKEKAEKLDINPYDLFAGIDVQEKGVLTPVKWNLFAKDNVPYTSLGLYCPSWTYFSAETLDDYESKENRLWVNEKGDPSIDSEVSNNDWHGVSTYAIEKTVVNKTPFITNFSLGNGYSFFINGEKVSSLDWNNRSMMDVMPTYRWMLKQEKNVLKPSFDYSMGYYGGNSIKLYGNMEKDSVSELTLYSSDLAYTETTEISAYLKADHEVKADLILGLEDGSNVTVPADTAIGTEWTKLTFKDDSLAGKVIKTIGFSFNLTGDTDITQINIGNFSIIDTAESTAMEQSISAVTVTDQLFDDDGLFAGIKLEWDSAENSSYYEIYKTYDDGSKSFLGVTTANAHYIHALGREENEEVSTFEVIPVNIYLERGTGASATVEWPNNKLPKANFSVSKTLCAPGEEIKFTSLASLNTTEWEWTFEGADTPSSTEESPTITYSEEGTYNVTLVAKNEEGTAEKTVEGMIVIRSDAKGELPLLSKKANTDASGFVNDNEAPQFAVDGKLDTKWCATGPAPHDITIDLGKEALVSEVYMAHAEAGGEGADMNTMWYTIEVSTDGTSFEQVTEVKTNSAGETIDTFQPTKARYIKVTTIKPTQGSDSAVRIYEIQVRGIKK